MGSVAKAAARNQANRGENELKSPRLHKSHAMPVERYRFDERIDAFSFAQFKLGHCLSGDARDDRLFAELDFDFGDRSLLFLDLANDSLKHVLNA